MLIFRHSPESGPRAKASGRSRWASASMAIPPTPFAAYSKGPGLTELVRLYVCGLQPRPSVQLSSSSMSLTDDEYSRGSGNPVFLILPEFRLALASASLAGMTANFSCEFRRHHIDLNCIF